MDKVSTKEIQQIIGDIGKGFSSIHHKVMELTTVSNDDFSALNKIMKNHHKTTHEITRSTTSILERIQALEQNEILLKLRSSANITRKHLGEGQENIKSYLHQIQQLNLDFKHIFIPILNFKQNVSTLKFLLTNLKLNQGLVNKEGHNSTVDLIEKLNKKIEHIQAEIPTIAKDVELLKAFYKEANEKAQKINNQLFPELEIEIDQLDGNISFLEKGIKKADSLKPTIEQQNQESFQNLNQVITNLQYHDIIRQKIEHIQDTHKSILDDLNNLEQEKNIIKKGLEYVKQIPGITEIQAGQLILTNKEYQNAIENISKKLIETANTLENVNRLSYSIFNGSENKKIAKLLNKGTTQLCNKAKVITESIEQLASTNKDLKDYIKTHGNHYQKLESIEDDISSIINEINKKLSSDNEIKTITGKLVSLLNDINESRNNIGKIIAAHQNNNLPDIIKKAGEQQKNIENQTVSESSVKNLIEEFEEINNQIAKNCEAFNQLDGQLKSTLENIKYYDFYEHEVEEIINHLNIIYKKILPFSEDQTAPGDLLTTMEKAYTMQSQRQIHGGKEDEDEKAEDDDDNLELF